MATKRTTTKGADVKADTGCGEMQKRGSCATAAWYLAHGTLSPRKGEALCGACPLNAPALVAARCARAARKARKA